MKMRLDESDRQQLELKVYALEELLLQSSRRDQRPCGGCEKACERCGQTACTCMCGAQCKHAPSMMSSDPAYPVEPLVVELVYGLNTLRVCSPYWSCEGHNQPNGLLYRVPQVWFYATTTLYPKLIADYVFNLHVKKQLQSPWQVSMAYADDALATGFKLEPALSHENQPTLAVLQADLRVIGAEFQQGVARLALQYLQSAKKRRLQLPH